ncbi:MAG: glycosyltransferase family 2 protein [Mariprofundaceae bacterium]|nr:glycosyltransferase family 2 protein [Mariprofundaceae bacterium]
MLLSVIIPAFNEASRLPKTLQEAYPYLEQRFHADFEIIVVDDGSSDHTVEAVQALMESQPYLKLLALPENKGKGAAVKAGMQAAQGDICLFMDADHSTHICEIEKVLPLMADGYGVVIASRQHPDSQIPVHQSWLREHMGKTFNLFVQKIVHLSMKDTQCGFKAFEKEACQYVFSRLHLDGFSFDVEALHLAQRGGYRIAEIPVVWTDVLNSRVQMVIDPLKMFYDLLKIRYEHRNIK